MPHTDVLGDDDRPLFFEVETPSGLGLVAPTPRGGVSLRTWARSLSGMQKEALVLSGATGRAWRLASDEGPYLDGYDSAPCPLSFMTTGMVASYANVVTAAARTADVETTGLQLTLDNYYTMQGSAIRGTMTGGALPPRLQVYLPDAPIEFSEIVSAAVDEAPIASLMRGENKSEFTLTVNGALEPVGRVSQSANASVPVPIESFTAATPSEPRSLKLPVIERLIPAEEIEGIPGGKGSSLEEKQDRTLHVRGVCTIREDGVKEIIQNLYSPIGSEFRFLSDEAPEFGGRCRAPDAATYMSAGIAFCFMTQFGRYAAIVRKDLGSYSIVQDTHFTEKGDPVETHVHLETSEGADFGRTALDMSEQTCFLHAFCRTDLATELTVA